jgi:hypothetical protein
MEAASALRSIIRSITSTTLIFSMRRKDLSLLAPDHLLKIEQSRMLRILHVSDATHVAKIAFNEATRLILRVSGGTYKAYMTMLV